MKKTRLSTAKRLSIKNYIPLFIANSAQRPDHHRLKGRKGGESKACGIGLLLAAKGWSCLPRGLTLTSHGSAEFRLEALQVQTDGWRYFIVDSVAGWQVLPRNDSPKYHRLAADLAEVLGGDGGFAETT